MINKFNLYHIMKAINHEGGDKPISENFDKIDIIFENDIEGTF